MNKIFNKILFFIFLYSIVMPVTLFSKPQEKIEKSVGEMREDLGRTTSLARFSGLKRKLKEALGLTEKKETLSDLFGIIGQMSQEKQVNEDSARKIFESDEVQKFFPKWYSPTLRTKIEFMDSFIEYSENRFSEGPKKIERGARGELFNYCKVVSMATTYRGYLKKPFIKIRKTAALLGAMGAAGAAGATFALLAGDMKILVAYKASIYWILSRLLGPNLL